MKNYDELKTLSDLMEQGYHLNECFSLLSSIYDKDYSNILDELAKGTSVEECILMLVKDRLFKQMFHFYITTTSLNNAILQSCNICIRINGYKKKMMNILSYPLFLLVMIFMFSCFSLFTLKPQFFAFYANFNITLSGIHYFLLQCLFYFPSIITVILIVIFIIIIYVIYVLKSYDYAKYIQCLKLPYIQYFIRLYISIKFAIYYSEFISLELDLKSSLTFIYNQSEDPVLKMLSYELLEQLKQGYHIEKIIDDTIFFDDYFKTIFKMSLTLSDYKDIFKNYLDLSFLKIERSMNKFKNILTPMTYAYIGIYIVGMYALMILPMSELISNF